MRASIACAAVLLVGCSRPAVLKADPEGSKPVALPLGGAADASTPSPSACVLPSAPQELVLGIERTIMPIRAPFRREAAEVTAHGSCTKGVECVTLSEPELEKLWKLFEVASRVRHEEQRASPHYGSRTITARWIDGKCAVSDDYARQVRSEDRDVFYASFDGIVSAAVAHRADAGKP